MSGFDPRTWHFLNWIIAVPDQAVRLVELLDEARDRCRVTIAEKRGEDMTAEEIDEAAAAMGYGAIKYADLKNNRSTDYK
jgi:arginyl-tRNA synthetase